MFYTVVNYKNHSVNVLIQHKFIFTITQNRGFNFLKVSKSNHKPGCFCVTYHTKLSKPNNKPLFNGYIY